MIRTYTLLLILSVWASNGYAQMAAEMQRAATAAKERRWADVISLTNPLIKREPKNLQALMVRSVAFIEQAKYQEALAASSTVLSVDPGIPQAWSLNIEALIRLRRPDSAMVVLSRAMARHPQDRKSVV